MVDDQSGFSVSLLHSRPTVLTLAGEHEATAAGDWAVLVPSGVDSCVGASFYASHGQGGALASDLSVTVTLSADVAHRPYALCLAHAPFDGGGTSPVDSDFDFHPHVTASVSFEPPSQPPSPPPPSAPPVLPPP